MIDKPLVAVITASSNSGSACVDELMSRYLDEVRVRAIFRTEEKATLFREKYANLEIVAGVDANELDTLNKAFEGVNSALIVTPHDPSKGLSEEAASNDALLTANMINAAVNNGVKYIVLVASFTTHEPEKMKIIASRFKPSEDLLVKLEEEKGIKWTVLRGGYFMENLFMIKDAIKHNSIIPLIDLPYAMIDTRDIGKSGAACLTTSNIEQHHGKYYDMTGPVILKGPQVAKIFSDVLGREIKYLPMSIEFAKTKMPMGIIEIYQYLLENQNNKYLKTDDVFKLTGQSSYLEDFVKNNKSKFL